MTIKQEILTINKHTEKIKGITEEIKAISKIIAVNAADWEAYRGKAQKVVEWYAKNKSDLFT